jgi:hypothetical protein
MVNGPNAIPKRRCDGRAALKTQAAFMSQGRQCAPFQSLRACPAKGCLPVDPRSYVTDQAWLAELKEARLPGAAKRSAA